MITMPIDICEKARIRANTATLAYLFLRKAFINESPILLNPQIEDELNEGDTS